MSPWQPGVYPVVSAGFVRVHYGFYGVVPVYYRRRRLVAL